MNENESKQNAVLKAMDVEYLPAIPEGTLDKTKCKKYPLSGVSSLGVAFMPLVGAVQSVVSGGGSGIYMVKAAGKQLVYSQEKQAYIGAIASPTGGVGGGMASLTQLPCDPTMLFMAAALMTIEKKLDEIQELQRDILDYGSTATSRKAKPYI